MCVCVFARALWCSSSSSVDLQLMTIHLPLLLYIFDKTIAITSSLCLAMLIPMRGIQLHVESTPHHSSLPGPISSTKPPAGAPLRSINNCNHPHSTTPTGTARAWQAPELFALYRVLARRPFLTILSPAAVVGGPRSSLHRLDPNLATAREGLVGNLGRFVRHSVCCVLLLDIWH